MRGIRAATLPALAAQAIATGLLLCTCRAAPRASPVDAAAEAREGCSYPLRIQDDRGVTVTLNTEPERIVSLLPSDTETLFALGAGPRVVGADDFSATVPGASGLPRLGGLYETRLELLLSLRPDLVLASDASGASAAIERAGIAVWAGNARRLDDVFRVFDAIGRIVCRPAEAEALRRRVLDDLADVERRLSDRPRVRVYYELDASLYTAGPSSFIGEMITRAGGSNIVPPDLGDFPKISPEAVIAANPEVVLGVSPEEVRQRRGWETIAAVRLDRVRKLSAAEAELVARPGPRIGEGLRVLARYIHPEVPQ
jgi:iron complex transport system substrate-binding protein